MREQKWRLCSAPDSPARAHPRFLTEQSLAAAKKGKEADRGWTTRLPWTAGPLSILGLSVLRGLQPAKENQEGVALGRQGCHERILKICEGILPLFWLSDLLIPALGF